MKEFADLHMCPSIENLNKVEKMVSKSSELGYHHIGISTPPNTTRQEIRILQKICSDRGIDFVTRLDFTPKKPRELLNNLRHFRRRVEVISVICISKSVARQAAKDRRVDLLLFPTDPSRRFFDLAEAELASGTSVSLEIDMAPLLSLKGVARTRLLSCLRKEVKVAKKFNVPIVASSGATNEYLLRSPHDYAALTSLFDLTPTLRLCVVSENSMAIIKRNREKLSSDYCSPGIRVIRR